MENVAMSIRTKALELGFENCGIIKAEDIEDYLDKIEERISRIPSGEQQIGFLRDLAKPKKVVDWAKSIVVAIFPYRQYNVPEDIAAMYGKHHLMDSRINENAPGYAARNELTQYMENIGIRTSNEPRFGNIPLRWAAYKAGLGIIRMNNFFYTENGSYYSIEGWIIDRELTLVEESKVAKCPENCGKCIDACPSKSLCAPYTMVQGTCVAFQNSMAAQYGLGIPSQDMAGAMRNKMYGCDVCQDVCPFNKNKLIGGEDFPGLEELSKIMLPENVIAMDYNEIRQKLLPKFWYIPESALWKWKLNALSVMTNQYSERYKEAILSGLGDSSDIVRDFAQQSCLKLGLRN